MDLKKLNIYKTSLVSTVLESNNVQYFLFRYLATAAAIITHKVL